MPRFGNLQDIWNKLDEILGQLSSGGNGGYATEAKQDDIILELQNILAEVELAATEEKQDDAIEELQNVDETLKNIDLNTVSTIEVLKFIAEQQVITNKYLRKIYNPK